MDKENQEQAIQHAIKESERCMKEAEGQLEKIKKFREKTGIESQASTRVVNNLPPSNKALNEAIKMLEEMNFSTSTEDEENKDLDKRRKRMGKTMRNKKFQI